MPLAFTSLQTNYPTASQSDLYNSLGGQWPSLIGNPSYANTCCVRLSRALTLSGQAIPATYQEAITGSGDSLILKVVTMGHFLTDTLGPSSWGMSKSPGVAIAPADLPGWSGIIVYHVAWQNATGHFDLWTGTNFVGVGNFTDIQDGYDVAMWKID